MPRPGGPASRRPCLLLAVCLAVAGSLLLVPPATATTTSAAAALTLPAAAPELPEQVEPPADTPELPEQVELPAPTDEPEQLPGPDVVDRSTLAPSLVVAADCGSATVLLTLVGPVTWWVVAAGAAVPASPEQSVDPRTRTVLRATLSQGAVFSDGGTSQEWVVDPSSGDLLTGCAAEPVPAVVVKPVPPCPAPAATPTIPPAPTAPTVDDDPSSAELPGDGAGGTPRAAPAGTEATTGTDRTSDAATTLLPPPRPSSPAADPTASVEAAEPAPGRAESDDLDDRADDAQVLAAGARPAGMGRPGAGPLVTAAVAAPVAGPGSAAAGLLLVLVLLGGTGLGVAHLLGRGRRVPPSAARGPLA